MRNRHRAILATNKDVSKLLKPDERRNLRVLHMRTYFGMHKRGLQPLNENPNIFRIYADGCEITVMKIDPTKGPFV